MTAERAVDEMCADRQLDLLFREPPLADVVRFPRRMTGGKANCMKCGRELPMLTKGMAALQRDTRGHRA